MTHHYIDLIGWGKFPLEAISQGVLESIIYLFIYFSWPVCKVANYLS